MENKTIRIAEYVALSGGKAVDIQHYIWANHKS